MQYSWFTAILHKCTSMGVINLENQELAMNIIVGGGEARSLAMEAISYAKEGKFEEAQKALKECEKALVETHEIQTGLIRNELGGNKTEIDLLMVHAQDHLMDAITIKDLAVQIVNIYRELHKKTCKGGD